ncbi:MAG: hypothetical protein JWP12_2790 [Bacteroidetes bacterium]|nr:hypothetical protein [Bacteroidota bacterium]
MLRISSIIIAFFILSSFSGDETYNGKFIGKKIAETPFGDYVKTDLPGTNVIMLVSYGCSHCWDATVAMDKLKKEKLIDTLFILGNGTTEEKEEFKQNTNTDYPTIDYDFQEMKAKIFAIDPDFPPPPCAILVIDNIITAVFIDMPSAKQLKKITAKK